eukprot:SAG31_NODE_284_length_18497_cov_11.811773_11_plen_118_part_00
MHSAVPVASRGVSSIGCGVSKFASSSCGSALALPALGASSCCDPSSGDGAGRRTILVPIWIDGLGIGESGIDGPIWTDGRGIGESGIDGPIWIDGLGIGESGIDGPSSRRPLLTLAL